MATVTHPCLPYSLELGLLEDRGGSLAQLSEGQEGEQFVRVRRLPVVQLLRQLLTQLRSLKVTGYLLFKHSLLQEIIAGSRHCRG